MHTTTTTKVVPVRFLTLELDEREARELIGTLEAFGTDPFTADLTAKLTAALMAPAADAAPLPEPALSPSGRERWICPECRREVNFYGRRDDYARLHPNLPLPAAKIKLATPKDPPVAVPAPVAAPTPYTRVATPEALPLVTSMPATLVKCGCGRNYATAGALQSHIQRDHDGVEPDEVEVAAVVAPPTVTAFNGRSYLDFSDPPLVGMKGSRL